MIARVCVRARRRGFVLAEAAVVYPTLLTMLLGGIGLGLAIFRSQEIAHMARESARWASLQAPEGRTQARLRSHLAGLPPFGIDPAAVEIVGPSTAGDLVTVTVRFSWTPEAIPDPIVLGSTAKARILD